MITLPALAVLGAGNMAGAVLHGLLASPDVATTAIATTNRSAAAAAAWSAVAGVEALIVNADPEANRTAVRGAGLVLVGVKPAQVLELLTEIAPAIEPDALVISLAAGVSCAAMAEVLPSGVGVVRTAASITSLVGRGVTGMASAPDAVGAERLALAESLLGATGDVVVVEEDQLHTIAALSGSGPAYLYFVLEQFTESAIHHGLEPVEADRLIRATFVGAAELLRVTGHSPAELRRQVSSPKGSTERATAVLAAAGLATVFDHAVDAAIARTREMGRQAVDPTC